MIAVNLDKARIIAHSIRRAKRAEEFAPLDEIIAKRLPGEAEAEAARVAVRAKYVDIQLAVDSASDVDGILAALPK